MAFRHPRSGKSGDSGEHRRRPGAGCGPNAGRDLDARGGPGSGRGPTRQGAPPPRRASRSPLPAFRRAARAAVAPRIDSSRPTVPVRRAALMLATRAAGAESAAPIAAHRPPDGFGDIDPAAAGRAAASAAAVLARYAGLIDEVSRNPGLTPQQRAAAISGLRQKQAAEAAGVSKAIMDAAKGAAKLRRMMRRGKG